MVVSERKAESDESNDANSEERAESDNSEDANVEETWTRVTGRKEKARLPPYWNPRFPVHLRAGLHSPSSGSSSEAR